MERLRLVVKEQLHPTLCNDTDNIEEAKALLAVVANTIRQVFNQALSKKKVSELGIDTQLDKNSPKYDVYNKVLQILNGETISTAVSMLEGMSQQIDSTIRKEMSGRKVTSLDIQLY